MATGDGLNLEDVSSFAQHADLLALQESEALNPMTGGRDVAGFIGAATQKHAVVYGLVSYASLFVIQDSTTARFDFD